MTLLHGRISMCRYRILTDRKRWRLGELNETFVPKQAKKIRLQGVHVEQRLGWSLPSELLPPNTPMFNDWDLSHCQVGSDLYLQMRLERRRVPAKLLQQVFRDRLDKLNAKRTNPLKTKERRELLAEVKSELTSMSLPQISYVDGLWRTENNELWVFSTGKRAVETYLGLFEQTFSEPFSLELVRLDPPLIGMPGEEWRVSGRDERFMEQLTNAVPIGSHSAAAH